MAGIRWLGGRRLTVVVASVVGLGGLSGAYFAGPALAEPSAAAAAHQQALVAGTPCTVTAKSCVDLESKKAWLFQGGKITRGPVRIAAGGNGKETPTGHSLRVYRKEKDHKSKESRLKNGQPAPMPWSVFFEDGGIAFHGGDPNRSSAGCIHLPPADAKAWFDYLQIGDQVQVVYGSKELAARAGGDDAANASADSKDDDTDGDDSSRDDSSRDDSSRDDSSRDDSSRDDSGSDDEDSDER